jgi:hypothetical protein
MLLYNKISPGADPTTSEFTTTTPALLKAKAFLKWEKSALTLKPRYAFCCVVKLYNAGVVIHDRRIGSNFPSDRRMRLDDIVWQENNDSVMRSYVTDSYIKMMLLTLVEKQLPVLVLHKIKTDWVSYS